MGAAPTHSHSSHQSSVDSPSTAFEAARVHPPPRLLRTTTALVSLATSASLAQATFDASTIKGPKWRMIGPFRGGRTKSGVGVPSQPNVFYMGMVNGGVWKTTDYGRIWKPIFDEQPGIDRRHRRFTFKSQRRVRGIGRGTAPSRPLHRRRRLQVDRRRQDMDAPRPPRRPADSADRHRPGRTPTGSSSRCLAIRTDPTRSVESSAP